MEWAERLLFGNSARKYEVKRVVVHNVNGAFTGRLSMNRRNACTFGVESRTRTTIVRNEYSPKIKFKKISLSLIFLNFIFDEYSFLTSPNP